MQGELSNLLRDAQGVRRAKYTPFILVLAGLTTAAFLVLNSPSTWFATIRRRRFSAKGHVKDCSSKHFKSETLKLIREHTFAEITAMHGIQKFESSDITGSPGGTELYCVLDNTNSVLLIGSTIGTFSERAPLSKEGAVMRWPEAMPVQPSGFEFIAYNTSSKTFMVGEESVRISKGLFQSRAYDVSFGEDQSAVHESCVLDFKFSHDNKGFEGGAIVNRGGKSYLLGLCEGNFCKGGSVGRRSGNGRIVVMQRQGGSPCTFETVRVIKLPAMVDFEDYSALSIWNESTVAITSQQDAAVFIGDIDLDTLKISGGKIYDLPRNDECEIKYCNIEGIHFLRRDVIVTVTDSMKGKARQHFRCREKDESLQIFQIPM